MNDAVKAELGKYWDNLPQDLSHKQEEFLLKASHAIDIHKRFSTEPEPYLSSVETLLDMHKNIAKAGTAVDEVTMNLSWDDLAAADKLQKMINIPFFMNAQSFEINNELPENPTSQDIAEFKGSLNQELLDNALVTGYEVTSIRKADPSITLEDAVICFSAMQDRAANHFGKTTGIKIISDKSVSVEENKIRHDMHEMVLRHPREVLVLTDGCEDTKIFGLSDLKAKIEKVSDRAKSVDPLNLDKSIDALQSNKQKGFSKQIGIGKELTLQEISALEKKAATK